MHEKISRDLSLASPRLDALTDLTDVPELLTLGAMPQYEARWSWSGNPPMSTDTASCAAVLGPMPGTGLATLMWTVPGGARETGGPYMRDPRHPRHFTDEFKRQIVDLYNAGKPKREIMDEYDLGKSTVERWIKSINATGSPRAADNRTPEQNRILELERENRRLRMEVDVLKQAALIYARK